MEVSSPCHNGMRINVCDLRRMPKAVCIVILILRNSSRNRLGIELDYWGKVPLS